MKSKRSPRSTKPGLPPPHDANAPVHGRESPRRDEWSEVATWYDQLVGDEGSEFHQRVILPGVIRLLQDATRIVDFACGQGVLCRKLAGLGHQVVGIDISEPLINAARMRQPPDSAPPASGSIEYLVGDVTRLDPLPSPLEPARYDAVTLVLAVQNLSPLSPMWRAAHTLLIPGGSLIVVMMHPSFRIPKQSGWFWDETLHRQSRTIDSYLTSSKVDIQTHPGKAAAGFDSPATVHHHRPLQAYVNTLASAGLLVDRVEEWASHKKSQPGVKQRELDRSRKEIPLFLALRARKVALPVEDAPPQ